VTSDVGADNVQCGYRATIRRRHHPPTQHNIIPA